MPNLTIRFIDSPGVVSRLITWATDSLWDHTECLNRNGTAWIGAHSGTGVQARPLDWVKPTRERRYALLVYSAQYQKAQDWLESKIGTPYDYQDIIGLMLKKRVWNAQRVICSTLMLQFMQEAGLQPLNCLPDFDALISPEVLHLSPLFIGRCVYQIS
jgi:hypothetical protein